MAPKRKATGKQAEEPAAKDAKKEHKEEPKEEPKEDSKEESKEVPLEAKEAAAEEPKEKEKDDKKDPRPSIKEAVCFHGFETTLNVVPTMGGKVLMALSDGGMQFLIAGARASVGVTSGRCLYEVKVVEALTPPEGRTSGRSRVPMPRQLVRLGFSMAGTSLVLGDGGDGCVCFDSEGYFVADKKRSQAGSRFGRDQVIGVLLNLDAKSPNANTVSLFCNGQRISEPQPVPEALRGQPLFPHVAFRNVSLQVNFGPTPLAALPFKCRMVQEVAKDDLKEVRAPAPKDGKYEVLFPVAFPDEGTFDWLDSFLEKNPSYVELSDRKIQDWAVRSGIWKPKNSSWKHSNDKPDYNFGLQYMDDLSIRRALSAIASVVPRNYVVMEVKQNLTPTERKANLMRFGAPCFKKVAHVVMGEPSKEYKERVHKKLLEEKQAKAEMEWKVRKVEKERKRSLALRQKEIASQKAALEVRQKEAEAAKKKEGASGGEKPKEGGEKTEEAKEEKPKEKESKEEQPKKEEKPKEEEKKIEKDKPKEEEKKEDEEEPDEPMPQVELSEEEKKLNFKQPITNDITPHVLNSAFNHFCIPEKDEGFDEIRFEWQNEAESKAYLKRWVLEKKITSRVEDIMPSEWFKTKASEFQKAYQEWQTKQKEFKDSKKDAPEEKKATDGEEEEEEQEEEEVKRMDVDIVSVENVCDVGSGEPLFSNFSFEDWALLTLRFELHLLQAAFKRDVNDPERVGIHESHLVFYYNRYFRKQLIPKSFGKDTHQGVVELVKDTVKFDPETRVLVPVVSEEPESLAAFVKMQEESRRKRQQRIDAGDETARLNFSTQQAQPLQWLPQGGWSARPVRAPGKGEAAPAAPAGTSPVGTSPVVTLPVVTSPVGRVPTPVAGSAPRFVPAPRSQSWQQQQQQQQQQGQGGQTAGGRWQQYVPRVGKGGKR